MVQEDRLTKAQTVAYALGISVYYDPITGRITQHGPGVEVVPPKNAKPFYWDSSMPIVADGDGSPAG